MASTLSAQSLEIFDPYAFPHIDSENNSFVDAIIELDLLCGAANSPWFVSLCSDVDGVINQGNECFEISKQRLPDLKTECQKTVSLKIGMEIQSIFNAHIEDNGAEGCRSNAEYQFFTLEHEGKETVFAFPCQPA